MFDKIRPLYDRLLIKRSKSMEEKTDGGIIIPDGAQEKAQTGEVVAVGGGYRTDSSSELIPLKVKVGNIVFFAKYSGTEAGEEYVILREEDVLGVIKK